MELYPSSQLGSKSDIINQEIAGDSVITLANGAFYADLGVSDFSVTFAPYLFRSWEDIEKLAESDWWAEQAGKIAGDDRTCDRRKQLALWSEKYHHKRTCAKPGGYEGIEDQSAGNQLQVDSMGALGAAGTPMSLGDSLYRTTAGNHLMGWRIQSQ